MTETPGSYAGESIPQPHPRLTHVEQMSLLMCHPFFTGKCPRCGQAIAQANVSLQQWHCGSCGTDAAR
jgi:ribosomal protein L37AE/L43A